MAMKPVHSFPPLLEKIATKGSDLEAIARRVARYPSQLDHVIEGLSAKPAGVKYGCAKVLRIISEQKPEVLLPRLEVFSSLLDSENSFLKWDGIHVLGNLATVDKRKKIDRLLPRYLAPIPGPVLTTAANVIGGAAKIAAAKPYLADEIAEAILKVGRGRYKTDECRNVAKGQAVAAFDLFFDHLEDQARVLRFVKRQLKNTRPKTRKQAETFFGKHVH